MWNALRIAFSTLTLLPVSPAKWEPSDVKLSVAFYPLVGAFVGGLLALTTKVHLAHDLKLILLLLVWVLLTGAFHLDGLSDSLDGFFGGKDPDDRRRIMKEPTIGAYGVVGIVLALIIKMSLLSHLLSDNENWRSLVLIPLAARWGVTLACTVFTAPPGDKGLGSQVVGLSSAYFAVSTLLSLAGGWGLLQAQSLLAFLTAGLVAMGIGFLSKSRIQGLTGDGMGAIIEVSEASLLFLICATLSKGFLSF